MQETQETRVQSLGWEDSLEGEMEPTVALLPAISHKQRRLADHKESDTTEQPSVREHTHTQSPVATLNATLLLPCGYPVALGMSGNRELGTGVGFTKKYSVTHYQF